MPQLTITAEELRSLFARPKHPAKHRASGFKLQERAPKKKQRSASEWLAVFRATPARPADSSTIEQQRALFDKDAPIGISIRLPMPPTVNHYQPHTIRHGKIVRHFTNEANAFKEAVSEFWKSHFKGRPPEAATGRLRVLILICYDTAAAIDLDNRIKPLADALMEAGAFRDDSQIDELHVRRGPLSRVGAYCDVWIESLEND